MSIFEYSDYRVLLAERFKFLQTAEGMSYRKFSAQAGFASPNFLQLVISGKRNLSIESCRKVAMGLKLNSREANFFELLVLANQSTIIHEKKRLTEKLIKLKTAILPRKGNIANYDYYKFWYNIPIREAFLVLGVANKKPEEIAAVFCTKLSKKEVKEAIKLLLALNFLQKDAKGKITIATEEILKTSDFILSSLIASFHIQMLELAKKSILENHREEREIGGVTIALSQDGFAKVRELIKEFKAKALAIAENDKNKSDVYQVGFQLFPLTRGLSEK